MFTRFAHCLVLILLVVSPLARAESLGETINRSIGSNGAAALAGMPPEALGAVHAASTLLAARSQGLVSDRGAALALAAIADELADAQPRLEGLEEDAFRVAMILQARVVMAGARELVITMPAGPERMILLGAAARLTEAITTAVDRRVDAGSSGPDNPCFQQYGACMEYCSERGDFLDRALCGMDCNLDFAACLGTVVGRGVGSLIGVFDTVLPGAAAAGGQ